MKLYLLAEQLKKSETKNNRRMPDGTFVGVRFDADTKLKVKQVIKGLGLKKPINVDDDLHTTVIYSRKQLPNFKSGGMLKESVTAKPTKFTLFSARDGNNALVMELDSEFLTSRHKNIMKEHEAEYDWPSYKPHLTLSYDAGDFDVGKHTPSDYIDNLTINEEYDEPLQLDWLVKNKS